MRPDDTSVFGWPTRLERGIAYRYLRSRRSRRLASLNTVISIGGVIVGVMALIVVLGVMNGLRNDLRERILVASPHLRILTYGAGLRVDNWEEALETIRRDPDVVAAAPEVITQSIVTSGADYAEAVNVRSPRRYSAASRGLQADSLREASALSSRLASKLRQPS